MIGPQSFLKYGPKIGRGGEEQSQNDALYKFEVASVGLDIGSPRMDGGVTSVDIPKRAVQWVVPCAITGPFGSLIGRGLRNCVVTKCGGRQMKITVSPDE